MLNLKHTVFVLALTVVAMPAFTQKASEYQVKAAFLFNFSKFLEWPPSAMGQAGEPFVIGILGADPFGSSLDEIVAGEKILDHPLTVKRFAGTEELDRCHILFINMPGKTSEAINALKGKSVLTVGDDNNFTRNGGIVRFFTENEMIHLEINIEAAKAANLIVSSKLLRIAKIYE
jgi:hypothetical protein